MQVIGSCPSHSWVASHLLDVVSQYPGGLTEAVILTGLATMQPKQLPKPGRQADMDDRLTRLSHHHAGKATTESVTSARITKVVCISEPGSNPGERPGRGQAEAVRSCHAFLLIWICPFPSLLPGPSSHRGGVWTLALQDGSTREPLLMYAHSSLAPILANCTHPSNPASVGRANEGSSHQSSVTAVSSLHGCSVRLAGPLMQPHRVPPLGGGKGGGGSQQGGSVYLPTRALVLELVASDPAWTAAELSTHPVLGGPDFGRVYDLSAVGVGKMGALSRVRVVRPLFSLGQRQCV